MALIAAYSKRNVFGLQPTPSTWNANITINSAGELAWSGTGTRIWARSPLGDASTWSYRIRFRKPANPSGSSVGWMQPLNNSPGSTTTRLRFGTSGQLNIDDLNGSAVPSGGTFTSLVQGDVYELAVYATAGTAQNIHGLLTNITTGSQHGAELNGTDDFSTLDNLRFGQLTGSPTLPDFQIIAFAVYNTGGAYPPAFNLGSDEDGPTVAIIGDSLFDMDSDQTSATVPDGPGLFQTALEALSWQISNVFYYGRGGKRIAVADGSGKTFAQNMTDAKNQLAGGSALDYVIVSLGTNDRAQSDSTINADLDTALAAIDTSTEIFWLNLTSKGSASTRDLEVNALISAKLAAWGGTATLLDWNSHIRGLDGGSNPSSYWYTGDSTHNTLLGNQAKVDFIAAALPDLGSSEGTGSIAYAFAVTGTGEADSEGTGALAHAWDLAGAGETEPAGTGSISHLWDITGAAEADLSGTGALAHAWNLTGAGETSTGGTGTLGYGFALSGGSSSTPVGTGTLGFSVGLSGSGSKPSKGSGGVAHSWELAGAGEADNRGTGLLGYGLVLAGIGATEAGGSGSLTHLWALSGAGHVDLQGAGTLAYGWAITGTGGGVAPAPFPAVLTLTATGTALTLTGDSTELTLTGGPGTALTLEVTS